MQTYLEKHDAPKNQARFYRMLVLPNLFGEWTRGFNLPVQHAVWALGIADLAF
jgi:hypothetical protein